MKTRIFFTLCRLTNYFPSWASAPFANWLDRWILSGTLQCKGRAYRLDLRRRQLFLLNNYEPEVFRWLERNVQPGDCCIDVGAHVGSATVYMALLAGADGKVEAIEPVGANCTLLGRNIRVNKLSQIVTVHNACCASSLGKKLLHTDSTTFRASLNRSLDNAAIWVDAVTLDSIRERKVNVVKVDVEGAEAQVLEGAVRMLNTDRPRVLIELHPPLADTSLEILQDLNYVAYNLEGRQLSFEEVAHKAQDPGSSPFHIVFLPSGVARSQN